MMRNLKARKWVVRVVVIEAVVASMLIVDPAIAQASTCGTSAGHTVCVTVPTDPLTGAATITVTNNPNSGVMIATWIPAGQSAITLIQDFAPSPGTNDYSFTWPTQKYLDASGVLRLQANTTSSTPVEVPVTLTNGNLTDFQHSPIDWQSFLPNPSWTAATDPVVVAVGDGASDEPAGDTLAQNIALSDPQLLLYLGDIYETGTFTENLNHYGQNSMDGGAGTLWGAMGDISQPALGDHEQANRVAWQDYFHGRPLYTSFEFANVLFLDLASAGVPFGKTSAQYAYVKSVLTSPTNPPPACVITFFQNPVIAKAKVTSKRVPMWSLITNNGGDLLFNGDNHTMIQYKPLNDKVQLPSPGQPTMVEMISGAGGHSSGPTFTSDARIEWSQGMTPGAVHLTLDGAAGGGVPTSLSWAYEDTNGSVLHSGTRDCGAAVTPPAPSISSFSPTGGLVGTSVTINGANFTSATDVAFNGTSATSFSVDSDAKITATVPGGAITGPISVTTVGGTGTSATNFTVSTSGTVLTFVPDADTWVQSTLPTTNFGSKPSIRIDSSPVKDGLFTFTVQGVGAGSIANVTLQLYCDDPSSNGGAVYRVQDTTWQEGSVTWDTAPAADPGALAAVGPVTLDTWSSVDLTPFVTADGTYSFEIQTPSGNGSGYVSKEGAAGFAPQLVVTLA